MKPIIYIADPEVLSIPIVECYEPLIDITLSDQLHYGEPPECELTRECYTKIRKSVFEKLCQAQADLPNGWKFKLYEGFRSLKVQQMLFEQEFERVKLCFPNKNKQEHFYETTRLISPVINLDGSPNIPAHNTGGAVDIEIIKEDGSHVDMGMVVKDWCCVDPKLCSTDCESINIEAKENRKLLVDIMQSHGFVNYPTEWWHFSYGDRYWAYHQPIAQAIYGCADELIK